MLLQLAKHHHFVEAVEQLGAEEAAQLVHHLVAHGGITTAVRVARVEREA